MVYSDGWQVGALLAGSSVGALGLEPWLVFTEISPWAAEDSTAWQLPSNKVEIQTGSESCQSCKSFPWKLRWCHFSFISLVKAATEPTHIRGHRPHLFMGGASKNLWLSVNHGSGFFLFFFFLFILSSSCSSSTSDKNVWNHYCVPDTLLSVPAAYKREKFNSVQFSRSVVSDPLRPHESQHARPPCPSPTPGVHSDSCPLSQWCHPAISSSVVPFSSCPQSLPASESFPMSQLFAWDGQSIGVSASGSVLPMNTQDWSPLEWTGWISLQSKGLPKRQSHIHKRRFVSSTNYH